MVAADVIPPRTRCLREIVPAQCDGAGRRFQGTGQQVEQRAFAGPARAVQEQSFAAGQLESANVEQQDAAGIAKA